VTLWTVDYWNTEYSRRNPARTEFASALVTQVVGIHEHEEAVIYLRPGRLWFTRIPFLLAAPFP
jgi:hypothetical protein